MGFGSREFAIRVSKSLHDNLNPLAYKSFEFFTSLFKPPLNIAGRDSLPSFHFLHPSVAKAHAKVLVADYNSRTHIVLLHMYVLRAYFYYSIARKRIAVRLLTCFTRMTSFWTAVTPMYRTVTVRRSVCCYISMHILLTGFSTSLLIRDGELIILNRSIHPANRAFSYGTYVL